MSEFIHQFWRERLGIGPNDKFTAIDGREYYITDVHMNNQGVFIDYESFPKNESGTLFNLFNMIDWNKTKLFNKEGCVLGKCKRNRLNDASVLGYEVIFTPKRHKLKAYAVRTPGVDCGVVRYTPKEFEEIFEIIEQFKG